MNEESTVVSRYYDVLIIRNAAYYDARSLSQLLQSIRNFILDSLDIMILFSYPSSIVIMNDYCNDELPYEAVLYIDV